MRRVLRVLFVAFLAVAIGGGVLAECAAGELTAAQQACCVSMGHDCGAAGREMECCPTDQQPQTRLLATTAKLVVATPVLVTGPLAIAPPLSVKSVKLDSAAVRSFSQETLKLPERPAFLLLSVLLI